MKAPPAKVRVLAARPEPSVKGYLIHGPEPAETDALRTVLCRALVAAGGAGSEVSRLDPQELRRDPAALGDALRATGLFGGRPIILVEGAADGVGAAVERALEGLDASDGVLVATAGSLGARSTLRKLFEGGSNLLAMATYAQPMGREEVRATLREAGVENAAGEALDELEGLARSLDPAAMRGLLSTLGLYMASESRPLGVADVAACTPGAPEGDADAVVASVSARDATGAVEAYGRAVAKGVTPGTIAMGLGRWFRQLHAVSCARDGPERAVERLRPPVFGPRREAMLRDARQWSVNALEAALSAVLEVERSLRSSGGPPDRAAVERLVVRLTMLRAR